MTKDPLSSSSISSENEDSSPPRSDSEQTRSCDEVIADELFPVWKPTPFWRDQDDIVISGISCRFPESGSIDEFKQNLMNSVDMITEDDRRWTPGLYDLPGRTGKLKDLTRFDAAAFSVHPKQANNLDPQLRILLEVVYEAIVDAGINPAELRGSRTGVYVGNSGSETAGALVADADTVTGYSLTGCTRSMFANRISYTFDFKGPSFAMDTACSSSMQALTLAVEAMRLGDCDYAIVAGSHLNLSPHNALQFSRLGMLSSYGACRAFDAVAEGYVRSEGIAAILLQRQTTAHRIYCTVLHSKANTDGHKNEGITFPNGKVQAELLREVYAEAGVDPNTVVYCEAHGTGTRVGDPQECGAISSVMAVGRSDPLLIGSVKSNMGHSEPTSGLASIAKVIIAMECGVIPPNLHFTKANPDIEPLMDGRLKVVAEKTPFNGGLVGINSFGFGGSNVHLLLRSNEKVTAAPPKSVIPKLFCYAGRTEEAVQELLDYVRLNGEDHYVYSLLARQANSPSNIMPYRGYCVFNEENEEISREIKKITTSSETRRPIWFIYSGMGTQWPGMAKHMMSIHVFQKTIRHCAAVLRPFGVDLLQILTNSDETSVYSNPMHSFVSIAAVQTALTDTLRSIGVEPDGIIGHSVGEVGCSYADGCLTVEQVMMCAYWRGRCILEANLPEGGMAAVGLTWEETSARCRDGVVAACHNAEDSVTISGPAAAVNEVLAELQAENIFAKPVKSAGVAFHSYFMQQISPAFKERLDKVITHPKHRSPRWLSSSVAEQDWHSKAVLCNADYHVNNFSSPVLFYDVVRKVPENAVVIEIAPHSLLQSILRGTLPGSCSVVGLMHVKQENQVDYILSQFGKLYLDSLTLHAEHLYPSVPSPVPRGTPMLSSLVKWDHSHEWPVVKLGEAQTGSGTVFVEDPFNPDKNDQYLLDHIVDNRVVYPFVGFIVLVWKAFCKQRGVDHTRTGVRFDDIHVYKPTIMTKAARFQVFVSPSNGAFEVVDEDGMTASGTIALEDSGKPFVYRNLPDRTPASCCVGDGAFSLERDEIYKEYGLRGYEYGPAFRKIVSSCNTGDRTVIEWNDNYVPFIDSMLQTALLYERGDTLRYPVRLDYIRIDPGKHEAAVREQAGLRVVDAFTCHYTGGFYAGGVEARSLVAQGAQRRVAAKETLEKTYFLPYEDSDCFKEMEEMQKELAVYSKHCQSLASLALKHLASLPHFSTVQLPSSSTSPCAPPRSSDRATQSLSSLLAQITEIPANSELLNNARSLAGTCDLSSDFLLTATNECWIAKTLCDIALENTVGHFTRCVQIEPKDACLAVLLRDYMEQHPLVQQEWCFLGRNATELIPSDSLQNKRFLSVKDHDTDSQDEMPFTNQDLVVLDRDILCAARDPKHLLYKISQMLREEGFVYIVETTGLYELAHLVDTLRNIPESGCADRVFNRYLRHEQLMSLFEECNFTVSSFKTDPSILTTGYLIRRISSIPLVPRFISIDDVIEFDWLPTLQHALEATLTSPPSETVWITSTKTCDNGTRGLMLCLKEESRKVFRIRCLTTDGPLTFDFENPSPQLERILAANLAMNHLRNGRWGTTHHMKIAEHRLHSRIDTSHAYINTLVRGDLSSLQWVQTADPTLLCPNENTCVNYCVSLNFRDIMLATGRLPVDAIPGDFVNRDCLLGMEFAGRLLRNGQRVMGILPAQALATQVTTHESYTWHVPDTWTLEQAASVPVVYTTVYYSLVIRGQLKHSDTVLIHSGSGGVGQAALRVALSMGCHVFTTVSSDAKRAFLKSKFPQLKDSNFADSRSTDFEHHIMQQTHGRGVDVLLNSLSDDKLQASARCVARHGRFLEIGKFDLNANSALGLSLFLRNVTFHGILLDSLFEDDGQRDWQRTSRLLEKGMDDGVVQPLPTTSFDCDHVEEAFRFMAQGRHMGKVVIKIRDEEPTRISLPAPRSITAVARTLCHPEHVYIVTGGLGGFGLEMCHWLVGRGAKKLILTSRSGLRSGYQRRLVNFWRSRRRVHVVISTCNVSSRDQTNELLDLAAQHGPVGGIFHLAMVLRDCLFENQTVTNFKDSAAAKYWGTKNLDICSRTKCNDGNLRWFVVFSSVSCGRGHEGQTNYGWANSCMEAIVEQRREAGFTGMAIEWGAVGDVGVIIDTLGDNSTVVGGTVPQRMPSCLSALDHFLTWDHPVVSSFVRADTSHGGVNRAGSTDVVAVIAHILGVEDPSQLDADASFGDLGLDSLMGVEIRQALERDFDMVLSMKDIRSMTINRLKSLVSGEAVVKPDTEAQSALQEISPLRYFGLRMEADELRPLRPLVELKSAANDKQPVFFVHSIEGIASTLESLAELTQAPVYCFQSTPDTPFSTIDAAAAHYIEHMRTVQPTGPYSVVGYSFGCVIAVAIASQLHNAGDTTNAFVLLDGSHQYMSVYRSMYRQVYQVHGDLSNNAQFESEILCAVAMRFVNLDYTAFRACLFELPDWQARLDATVERMAGGDDSPFSDPEVARHAATSIYAKFCAADKFNPEDAGVKIPFDCTLIRAKTPAVKDVNVDRDFGLKNIFTGTITIHEVEGDHDSFIHDENATRTAGLINQLVL